MRSWSILFLVFGTVLVLAASDDSGVDYDFDFDDDFDMEFEIVDETQEMRELHKKGGKVHHAPPPVPFPVVPIQAPPMLVQAQVVVQETEQRMSCPEGFDLINNRCVMNEVLPGDFSCPPGTQSIDGRCAQFTRGRRDCPEGFRLSGSRCLATEIIPVQFTCVEGELDESGTGCRIIGDSNPVCAPGYVMQSSGLCSQSFPAQLTCPEGHVIGKKGCYQQLDVGASPMCPTGAEMDPTGQKCFVVQPGKAKCPKGFKLSADTGKCVKKAKKGLAACPLGFTEFSGHKAICEKMIQVPPQLSCHQGSVLDPITGQCTMESPSAIQCPVGFQQSNGLCEQIVEEVGMCPPGTSTIGYGQSLRCQSTIDHEIIECCAPGFEMSMGRCVRNEVFTPSTQCEGDCARVRTTKPQLSCPIDFTLLGRKCSRQVAHPCPEIQAPVMPSGCEVYLQSHNGRSLRQSEEDQIPANCIQAITVQQAICHTEETVAADIVCMDGDFDGVNCVVREMINVEPTCRVGIMDQTTGQCVRTTSVPMKTECPAGTTRIGHRCVEYQEHAPEFSCPDESFASPSGVCVIRAPVLSNPGQVVRTPPIQFCPSGTLQGSMCYDVERVPRQLVCPPGAIPASKHFKEATLLVENPKDIGKYCLQLADLVMPPPQKKYIKPKFYCPDGKPAKGKHCHSHHSIDAVASCPPGSALNGELCSRTMPPVLGGGHVSTAVAVPMCPSGTVVQGTKCVATRETDASMLCPPGYVQQSGRLGDRECVKFSDMYPVCPAGTQQTPDGCLRERSVAPQITHVAVNRCESNLCDF